MEIARHKDHLEISEFDPFLAELLRQVPTSARAEGDPAAEARIFSAPSSVPRDELCSECEGFVEPELADFPDRHRDRRHGSHSTWMDRKDVCSRQSEFPGTHGEAW